MVLFFSSLLVVTESSQRAGIAYRAIVCEVEMAGVAATATQHTDKMGNGNAEVTNRNTKRQTGTIQNISQHIRVMEKKKNTNGLLFKLYAAVGMSTLWDRLNVFAIVTYGARQTTVAVIAMIAV